MFTGIIEAQGSVVDIIEEGTNKHFWLEASFAHELKVDQSLAHDGVCLTVVEISGSKYRVTAVDETLKKTTLGLWQKGKEVNLERCLPVNGRLDGHFVQGHCDGVGKLVALDDKSGSYELSFEHPGLFPIVEKGSMAINGISLTIWNVSNKVFTVAIIPYTWEHTNLKHLSLGSEVNLEYDILGKYAAALLKGDKSMLQAYLQQ